MELSNIQKAIETKEVVLTVRTTQKNKDWMDKKRISPSLLFDEAIKELKQNVRRKICVICKKPSVELWMGNGIETTSFCSKKCMEKYLLKDPSGEHLEIEGSRIYVE
jgi:hypothetical protein